jgi:hypothetical protein
MTIPARAVAQAILPVPRALRRNSSRAYTHSAIGSLLFLVVLLLVFLAPAATSLQAQEIDKPLQSVDDEITAFAFSSDGRIVYSVNRGFKTKQYDLEHDDIWILEPGGKRRRIFQGEKFLRGTQPFTYVVDSFRWSPSGKYLLAQLFTTTVLDESGKTEDSVNTLAIEDNGREVRPGGTDSFIQNASDAMWLADSSTFVYLTEALKPRVLFSFRYDNLKTGPAGPAFEGRTFLDADPLLHTNIAIAVERDRAMSGPPRLQRLDMLAQDDQELATLDGYEGGLCVSPSGHRVAYFIDKEILEVRDLDNPARAARLRVGFGVVRFSPDDSRIFVKHAPEKKSGDLVMFAAPELSASSAAKAPEVLQPDTISLLHGLAIREFAISPDGRLFAVVPPGKRNLLIFSCPSC